MAWIFFIIFYVYHTATKAGEWQPVYCNQIFICTNKQNGANMAGLIGALTAQLKTNEVL